MGVIVGRVRASTAAIVLAVLAAATACYPPSQAPVGQSVPPGGRVVATSPTLTDMEIEGTTPDLATITYYVTQVDVNIITDPNVRLWVYDDHAGTSTPMPAGKTRYPEAEISPDGRAVVFSSSDKDIQVGPTAVNCWRGTGPTGPPYVAATCRELYLYDLDTGLTRQLTGLTGSSEVGASGLRFTADGSAIEYTASDGRSTSPIYRRLDLTTGTIEDLGWPPPPVARPTSWDRGDHVVAWDDQTGTLTSTDDATGDVTVLWSDPSIYALRTVGSDGRYIVVSNWENNRELFRLIDTDTGAIRVIKTPWVSDDGSRFALVQLNVAPDAIDRLILAPVQW